MNATINKIANHEPLHFDHYKVSSTNERHFLMKTFLYELIQIVNIKTNLFLHLNKGILSNNLKTYSRLFRHNMGEVKKNVIVKLAKWIPYNMEILTPRKDH